MQTVAFRIERDEARRIAMLAAAEGRSPSAVLRDIVREALDPDATDDEPARRRSWPDGAIVEKRGDGG